MNVNTENERKTSEDIYTSQNEFQFINRRARSYTEFVEHIVRNAKTTLKLKIAFFIILCVILICTTLGGVAAIICVACRNSVTANDIGVALTGLGSVLASLIVLPKIVAKHLFPPDSEQVYFDFIRDNQRFDLNGVEDPPDEDI